MKIKPSLCSVILAAILISSFNPVLTSADAPSATTPVVVPRSQQFDITSKEGRPYRIYIAEPKGEAPPGGFAVLYVLDGNTMFLTATEAVRLQKGLVPTVVVGIGYPPLPEGTSVQDRRYYDFTPVTPVENLIKSSTEPPVKPGGTGGQKEFLTFIDDTLKPEIAKRFTVNPRHQAIFGHSLAGRFVLYALFNNPDSFNKYVAASPSIWWDKASILQDAKAFIAAGNTEKKPLDLLVTVAEFEQKSLPSTPKDRVEFLTMARMVDNARDLTEQLKPLEKTGLRAQFVEYADENHGSVVPFAISRSLRFALKAPPPPTQPVGK